jgi:hypothetical protein
MQYLHRRIDSPGGPPELHHPIATAARPLLLHDHRMIPGARHRARTAARCAWLAASLHCMATSTVARAWPVLQAVGDTSVGYTDSFDSSPSTPVVGVLPRQPAPFALLSPGLVVAVSTRRTIQRVTYAFTYTLVMNDLALDSSANHLEYAGFFDLSPGATLLLGAQAVQSNTDAATGLGQGGLLPGPTSYLAATSDNLLSLDIGDQWRAWQGADALWQTPLSSGEAAETTGVGERTGLERTWRASALGGEARLNYTTIRNGLLLDGSPSGPQEQLTSTAVVQWRQDLGRHFTGRLEAGALRVDRLNTGTGFWSPAGAAVLAFTNDLGEADVAYDHAVTSNPVLGQYLLVDEVKAHAALPILSRPEVLLTATTGYQAGQILDENASPAAQVDTLLVDVGVGYRPTASLMLGLRYQHVERWSSVSVPPLPLSFTRNTVLLSATFKLPADRDMPTPYRAPRRVDRADEIRDALGPADR